MEREERGTVVQVYNALRAVGIREGAWDIPSETFERCLVFRFRVDGTLREMLRPGRKLASLLVSRIKVMARLDI
ncbi:ATPase, T2SS/T4P/T4SS family, partial [Escherichia coli]|uniref:ATPase, T2SS/T4P/T4SS family n=1 Tax=Escherichia coli TaxID=562 RepID=UPI004044104E